MILLRGEVDYPIITPALSLVPLRLPPLHQMEMNRMTATQSKTEESLLFFGEINMKEGLLGVTSFKKEEFLVFNLCSFVVSV